MSAKAVMEPEVSVIKNYQIILGFVFLIFGIGSVWGVTTSRINSAEAKITEHSDYIIKQKEYESHKEQANYKILSEVQLNLKNLCEKQGMKYQTLDK